MLYCYDTGRPPDLNDVHAIVRKAFKERVAVSVEGTRVYVATDETPLVTPNATFDMVRLPEGTLEVELSCNVVFDSKSQGIFRKEWRTHEAFAMFTSQAGLKPIDSEIYNLGLLETHKFTIRTAFRIYGIFNIVDRELFDNAYFNGVGGRRSYGFGLIIIKNFK